jgi:carbamoyl-phosphate synthase/aspartate carbamoyltransferase
MTPSIDSAGPDGAIRPSLQRLSSVIASFPSSPFVAASYSDGTEWADGVLELADTSSYRGISFGAEGKSISGECVFQTGLDPSHVLLC